MLGGGKVDVAVVVAVVAAAASDPVAAAVVAPAVLALVLVPVPSLIVLSTEIFTQRQTIKTKTMKQTIQNNH